LVRTFGDMVSIRIEGSISAGNGESSASVAALGTIGSIYLGGSLDGSTPTSGPGSASISASALPRVTIATNVLGGAGLNSGSITADAVGAITILGQVSGADGDGSGSISARGAAKAVTIIGDLSGGAGKQSGTIFTGADPEQPGTLASATIGGKLLGGEGESSGSIIAVGAIKQLKLGGITTAANDVLVGGDGAFSGTISGRGLANVRLSGNVSGGLGHHSGSLFSYDLVTSDGEFTGDIGVARVTGTWSGGAGADSGVIRADGKLQRLTVGALTGGTGSNSATIQTGLGLLGSGDAQAIEIRGSFGQAAANPGAGSAGIIIGGHLDTLSVHGNTTAVTVQVGDDVRALQFGGDISDTTVTARGRATQGRITDVALGRLIVNGNVIRSSFLAGYNLSGAAANPDAQIGVVTVDGAWGSSNIVAGAAEGADAGFGNEFDVSAAGEDNADIISKIGRILIRGAVSASNSDTIHFGFVAQFIAGVKIGAVTFRLDAFANAQVIPVEGDRITIRELQI
jgi:hypothetical protein